MKRVLLLSAVIAVCLSPITTPAQTTEAKTYTATEAAKHVGENATVIDRVDGVHQSSKGNIFLNMGGKYPNQAFTAYIPAASASQFLRPQQYEGMTIAVSGKIALYNRKPEILVSSPSQITVQAPPPKR